MTWSRQRSSPTRPRPRSRRRRTRWTVSFPQTRCRLLPSPRTWFRPSRTPCRICRLCPERLAGFADAVDGCPARGLQSVLDAAEAVVHGPPARVDQVDEQTEVVDARAALGEQLGLDPLQPADRLVREPAHLGELA